MGLLTRARASGRSVGAETVGFNRAEESVLARPRRGYRRISSSLRDWPSFGSRAPETRSERCSVGHDVVSFSLACGDGADGRCYRGNRVARISDRTLRNDYGQYLTCGDTRLSRFLARTCCLLGYSPCPPHHSLDNGSDSALPVAPEPTRVYLATFPCGCNGATRRPENTVRYLGHFGRRNNRSYGAHRERHNEKAIASYCRKLWIRCGNEKGGVPFRVGNANPGGSRVEGDATDVEGSRTWGWKGSRRAAF